MSKTADIFVQSLKNFLQPIASFLEDESITEIMINGPNSIWIEVAGKVKKTNAQFPDEDSLIAAVNNIAQSVGRRVDELNPRLDARLPNGFRIHAVLPLPVKVLRHPGTGSWAH
jgi:pilus assembly protein CpaF